MNSELKRPGHPMLAAFLTVSIGTFAQAEPPDPVDTIPPMKSEELELLKEEEPVSIATVGADFRRRWVRASFIWVLSSITLITRRKLKHAYRVRPCHSDNTELLTPNSKPKKRGSP
jgi:hypothetical protein